MAERKHVDWEGVERDYSAGLLSLRELAEKYGTKEGTIRSRAKVHDWSRDLSKKIYQKVEQISRKEISRSSSRSELSSTEREIVQANACAIVSIKFKHQKSINRVNNLVDTLFEEIEELSEHKNADNLPVRVDMTKKLMDTLRISIDKERQAFGITDAPTPTDDAIRDLLKGLNKNALNTQTTFDLDDDE